MKDLCLKFENKELAEHALMRAGFQQDDSGSLYMPGVCLDVIGSVYTTDTPDAEEPDCTPVAGWHVNLRVVGGINSDALTPYTVEPVTPLRVWA